LRQLDLHAQELKLPDTDLGRVGRGAAGGAAADEGARDRRLWVPESRYTSRDLLILMDEAAAAVASSELVGLGPSAVGKRA
jgi:hypothetical protein